MASLRDAALALFETLDRLEIKYAVGGSVASSLHGIARATQDVDIVVDFPLAKVSALYDAIRERYYADTDMMLDAISRGSSFNVIHVESGYKFDLFVASRHPLGYQQLAHRQTTHSALLGGEPAAICVISAEDTVLVKLHWYQTGGCVSERQWNDLVNLIAVQRNRLDVEYLEREALRLGVSHLLRMLIG
jgi:hypothetical protein